MIEYKCDDILKEDVEAIVNTVNCVGIMGRGIALQFKHAFPQNFNAYLIACKNNQVTPGKMFVFHTNKLTNPRYIINFPTKRHWREKSRIEDIQNGLKDLVEVIHKYQIQSIAIPPLGSGLGGLKWEYVKSFIEAALQPIKNVRIIIYEPHDSIHLHKITLNHDIPKMTPARAALIGLIYRYLKGLLDPYLTLLEIHKLMYFMQVAGEPLKLNYKKGPYGPYAQNLRHMLSEIEGHLISGFADGGEDPNKSIKLIPGAIENASVFLNDHAATQIRFNKVSDLVEGFESPFGLELLSTIHWITQNEKVTSIQEIIDQTYAWNQRKKQFSKYQITLALKVLTKKGWTLDKFV